MHPALICVCKSIKLVHLASRAHLTGGACMISRDSTGSQLCMYVCMYIGGILCSLSLATMEC